MAGTLEDAVVRTLRLWLWITLCLALTGCSGPGRPIRVGVLHSLTGSLAGSERNVADATLLAVEELNQSGGVLGRPLEPYLVDGQSSPQAFAEGARELLEKEVDVVFGCWSSACRKEVIPILERNQCLLFYPVQYEGLEQSPYVVYTGAAPNQQLLPAVKWASDNIGKKFYLVGSDYVYPHTAHEIARVQIEAIGGEVVGERYVSNSGVEEAVAEIKATKPDVILNTVNGDTNLLLFSALREAGIDSQGTPTMSLSLSEGLLREISPELVEGDYATWSYFQSLETPENREFVAKFKRKYGADRVTDAPTEAAYFGVHLWAQAVELAQTTDSSQVRLTVVGQAYAAPQGVVCIDSNQHTWKNVRVGQINAQRQFSIVWDSEWPVQPIPYPFFRSQAEWELFLTRLQDQWGGQWQNPNNL